MAKAKNPKETEEIKKTGSAVEQEAHNEQQTAAPAENAELQSAEGVQPEPEKENSAAGVKSPESTDPGIEKSDETEPEFGSEEGDANTVEQHAAQLRVPSWQHAALCRYLGWQPGKTVTGEEYRAGLDALATRRQGGSGR